MHGLAMGTCSEKESALVSEHTECAAQTPVAQPMAHVRYTSTQRITVLSTAGNCNTWKYLCVYTNLNRKGTVHICYKR